MSENASLEKLRKASQGWVSKAMSGVDKNDLARELKQVNSLISRGIDAYIEGNYPDSVASLGKAKSKLGRLKDKEWGEDADYYRCIYEGGDGSAYESGFYRDLTADNAIQAIDQLMDIVYRESNTLSRR
jgi:hypothetical protein